MKMQKMLVNTVPLYYWRDQQSGYWVSIFYGHRLLADSCQGLRKLAKDWVKKWTLADGSIYPPTW